MTLGIALAIVALWLLASFPLAVLIGRSISLGHDESRPSPVRAEAAEVERFAA